MPFIGFPSPLLGEQTYRLTVFAAQAGVIVLEKPPGVLVDRHPWYPDSPCLTEALQSQLDADKPELDRFALKHVRPVYLLDPEASGAVVYCGTADLSAKFRNDYGSNVCMLRFQFLARNVRPDTKPFTCELPLAVHAKKNELLVSHRTGKQAKTCFRHLESIGPYSCWEALVPYYRLHQVRCHAAECGLHIVGEDLYTQEPLPYLSQFKRRYKGRSQERPLYPGIYLHLAEVQMPALGHPVEILPPQKLKVALERLSKMHAL